MFIMLVTVFFFMFLFLALGGYQFDILQHVDLKKKIWLKIQLQSPPHKGIFMTDSLLVSVWRTGSSLVPMWDTGVCNVAFPATSVNQPSP